MTESNTPLATPENGAHTVVHLENQVRDTLLDLMSGSESDSVRVSAAKALMDKILQNAAESEEGRRNDELQRRAAISEARDLLEKLAERISGSNKGAAQMAAQSPNGTNNTA